MAWIDEAASLPVAFAQVREDPRLDLEVVEKAGAPARVIAIASGGDTAAFLAASGKVSHLTLVDPNPAQIELAKTKLALVAKSPDERLRALGHKPHDENGLDYRGRYERLFRAFRESLGHRETLLGLALKSNLPVQRALADSAGFRTALVAAFEDTFAHRRLVRLFGEGATGNARVPFAGHFFERTHAALSKRPIADNPWLAQLVVGRFGRVAYPWLERPAASDPCPTEWRTSTIAQALEEASPAGADVVHLSNVLDWLSPDDAQGVLERAARALRPGGRVVVRQLNSSLDVPALGASFEWDASWGASLLERDESFFYRAIHVGRRP